MTSKAKTDPTGPSRSQTRRYEAKRELILSAAAKLFNERGVRGTTLADVATSVGLITTSVTYYFKKKDDLAVACFLRTIDAIHAVIDAAEAATLAQPNDPVARLRAYMAGYFAEMAAVYGGQKAEFANFNDVRTLTGEHRETVFKAYRELFRRSRGLFEMLPGLSRPAQNARAHLLFSINLWAPVWVLQYEPEDYARAADRMCDILLGGLLPDGAAWPPPALGGLPEPADGQKEAFLQAATAAINEQGYTGASVDRISARLKVTKGSFYHHNDTKDDLVSACFERTFQTVRGAQNAVVAAGGSGGERLARVCDGLVRLQVRSPGALLRTTALSALPEDLREATIQRMARLSERYAAFIVDGVVDGSVKPVDPFIASRLIDAMINAASELHDWVPGVDETAASELYVRPLFQGLLSPAQ